jgi:hypothetical protein
VDRFQKKTLHVMSRCVTKRVYKLQTAILAMKCLSDLAKKVSVFCHCIHAEASPSAILTESSENCSRSPGILRQGETQAVQVVCAVARDATLKNLCRIARSSTVTPNSRGAC